MPTIPSDAPRIDVKFKDTSFRAPMVFTEGHALTAPEAAWMNRQLIGTIGNMWSGALNRAVSKANSDNLAAFKAGKYTGPTITNDKGKVIGPQEVKHTDFDLSTAQADFDETFTNYVLGASNRGSGEGALSTLDRFIRNLASEAVKGLLKRNGKNIVTVQKAKDEAGNSVYAKLVDQYIAKHPELRDLAQAQLAAIGSEATDDFDMFAVDGIEEPAATPEAQTA